MNEQEQKNKSNSFVKQQLAKGKKIQDKAKKTKKIVKIIALVIKIVFLVLKIFWPIILGAILLTAFYKILDDDKADSANNARTGAILTNISSSNSSPTDADGRGNVGIVINGGQLEFNYNHDENYLSQTRDKIGEQTDAKGSDFNDFEVAVIGSLIDHGANLEYFTEEELHCLAAFVKAEACTQNLDLRPNYTRFLGDTYIPQKLEDLSENGVPGTVLIRRTNVKKVNEGEDPVYLEYIDKETFDNEVNDADDIDDDIINKFTVDGNGNIVIAKWRYYEKKVEGEYPEEVGEEEREQEEEGRYIIETETINYMNAIKKYKMPFEFLIQLLIYSDAPEFCLELVDYVLDSKIIIDVLEEVTEKEDYQKIYYEVETREEKNINYSILVDTTVAESKNNENIYDNSIYDSYPIIITKITEDTTYKIEVSEVDNWLLRYEKTYEFPDAETVVDEPEEDDIIGDYIEKSRDEITDNETINNDEHVQRFIREKNSQYGGELESPTLKITKKRIVRRGIFAQIDVLNLGGEYTTQPENRMIRDPYNEFDNPYYVKTKETRIDNETTIPSITYVFNVNKEDISNLAINGSMEIATSTDVENLVQCIIYKLIDIISYKVDKEIFEHVITTTEYIAGEEDVESEIYTTDSHGNFVKFLAAFDNSPTARNNIDSIDTWLFEKMKENTNTVELIDIVKYLLYEYDGKNRGVTELDLENLTKPDEINFNNASGGMDLKAYLEQFSMGHEGAPRSADGKFYLMFSDGYNYPTIGDEDLAWQWNHKNCNKSGTVLENGVVKTVNNVEEYVLGKLGSHDARIDDSTMRAMGIYIDVEFIEQVGEAARQYWIGVIDDATRGLNLSKQQKYALIAVGYGARFVEINGKSFKDVYLEGAGLYEIDSWQHNKYIWNNWWSQLGGGQPGHIKGWDARFETYVKGVFNFDESEYGQVFGRKKYLFYSREQISKISYAQKLGGYARDIMSDEEVFTYVENTGFGTGSGDVQAILDAADWVYKDELDWEYNNGGLLFWNNIEKSINNPNKVTCCATFVGCILYKAGIFTEQEMNSFNYNYPTDMARYLEQEQGWIRINSYDELEPGDVVFMRTDTVSDPYAHVQLYAGDDMWYCEVKNSLGTVHSVQPFKDQYYPRRCFSYGLRMKNNKVSTVTGSGDANAILKAAQIVHDDEMGWHYFINNNEICYEIEEALNNPNKATCCSTYVSCVLYKAGLFTRQEMNKMGTDKSSSYYGSGFNSPYGIAMFLKEKGWQRIDSYNQLKPGDIVFTSNEATSNPHAHVQIYAGDGLWYNAGANNAIQNPAPYNQYDWARPYFSYALRIKK